MKQLKLHTRKGMYQLSYNT